MLDRFAIPELIVLVFIVDIFAAGVNKLLIVLTFKVSTVKVSPVNDYVKKFIVDI